jgi:hypothetical protein
MTRRTPWFVALGITCSALFYGSAVAQCPGDWLSADGLPGMDNVVRTDVSPPEGDGLSDSDWSGIRTAHESCRHAVTAVEKGYQSYNPGQQWRTQFDGHGFLTTPQSGGWSWGLELIGYGVDGAERAVSLPLCTETTGARISCEWDETLTEWYINDRRGLEHGYTVNHRPDDSSGLLQFNLAVRGGLRPRVTGDGRNVSFVGTNGAAVVSYNGLTVIDAGGRSVPAWFEESMERLRLSVDDRSARYPLTIDPIAQQAYMKASNTGASDEFGFSVAVSGDTVVVGARREDSNATGIDGEQTNNNCTECGAAYVFVRDAGAWTQQAYLKAPVQTVTDQFFGYSVAVSGDTIVVGASSGGHDHTGEAHVFVRNGTTWSQQAVLTGSPAETGSQFGFKVAVSGDTAVVTAIVESGAPDHAGAVYVFVRNGTVWTQQAHLVASNPGVMDAFGGAALALSGDTLVAGAGSEDSNATGVNGNQADDSAFDSGAAYVFVRSGTTWSQQAYLKASNTAPQDHFGASVSVSNDTVVVGAWGEDSAATGVNGNQADNTSSASGAAYVFVRSGATWSQQAYLKASNTGAGDNFGLAAALSGDTLIVGGTSEDSNAVGVNGDQANNSASNSGAAYVFVRNGTTWSQQNYLKASNTGAGDLFGLPLALSGNTAVIGAVSEDSNALGVNGDQADNSASTSGAAYVFDLVPCPTFGDMNCNCSIEISDIDAFVLALLDPAGYAILYPGCNQGDAQPDGNVDGGDLQAFVDVLIP